MATARRTVHVGSVHDVFVGVNGFEQYSHDGLMSKMTV